MVQPINGSGSSWKGSQANTEEWIRNIDIESVYENSGTAGIIKIKAGLEKVLSASQFTLSPGCRSKINDLLSQIDEKSKLPESKGKSKFQKGKEAVRDFALDNTQWMNDNLNVGGVEMNKWALGATVAAEGVILAAYGIAALVTSYVTATTTTAAVVTTGTMAASNPGVQNAIQRIPTIFTNNIGLANATQQKLVELAPKTPNLMNLVNQYVRSSELFRKFATSPKTQEGLRTEMQSLKGQIETAIRGAERGQALWSAVRRGAIPVAMLGGITWGVKTAVNKIVGLEKLNIPLDVQNGIAKDKMLPPGYKVTGASHSGGSYQVTINVTGPKGPELLLLDTTPLGIASVSNNNDGKSITVMLMDEKNELVQLPPVVVVRDN